MRVTVHQFSICCHQFQDALPYSMKYSKMHRENILEFLNIKNVACNDFSNDKSRKYSRNIFLAIFISPRRQHFSSPLYVTLFSVFQKMKSYNSRLIVLVQQLRQRIPCIVRREKNMILHRRDLD